MAAVELAESLRFLCQMLCLKKGWVHLTSQMTDVPVEPKPDAELILELLLPPVDGPNKLSNSLSAAYLSPIDTEPPEAETSGPNPAFDAADGCEGTIIKKKIKTIRSCCVVITLKVSEFTLCLNCSFQCLTYFLVTSLVISGLW